jgi:DNA-binding NarL/FixJ family response regulator
MCAGASARWLRIWPTAIEHVTREVMEAEHAHKDSKGVTVSARLGGARADFVAGLGRKVADLKRALERARASEGDPGSLEELHKKLKALGTGAKLMKFEGMAAALEGAREALDRVANDPPLRDPTLVEIGQLLVDLPALAWGDPTTRHVPSETSGRSQSLRCTTLVLGTESLAESLRGDLVVGTTLVSLECVTTESLQKGVDLARFKKPRVILLDADLDGAYGAVETLMDDPLADDAAMLVVGSFTEAADSARYLALGVARVFAKPVSHTALRSAFEAILAPRDSVPEQITVDPFACADDTRAPLCESPLPGKTASLEQAVLDEILERSESELPASVAVYEPTLVDSVVYAEKAEASAGAEEASPVEAGAQLPDVSEHALPVESEAVAAPVAAEIPKDTTPLPSVTTTSAPSPKAPKKKSWSLFTFFAATLALCWGVAHAGAKAFASSSSTACELGASSAERGKAPKAVLTVAEEVTYTPITDESELSAGKGAIDVMAPADAVVLVDGKEQARGSTRIQASPGNHDVRIRRQDAEERGCTIDVRSSRTAHVKL